MKKLYPARGSFPHHFWACSTIKKKVRAQTVVNIIQLWQSRVEIEDYFVAYFDRIAAFEAPYT